MLYNYRVVNMLDGSFAIERYGLSLNKHICYVTNNTTAEIIRSHLYRETTDMSADARNEALDDIRRDMFIKLQALDCVKQCKTYADISITQVLEEVAKRLES